MCCKRRESIDHPICSFLRKGSSQDKVARVRGIGLRQSPMKGETKVNKGDMEQERGVGVGGWR